MKYELFLNCKIQTLISIMIIKLKKARRISKPNGAGTAETRLDGEMILDPKKDILFILF